jgi:hypothetical protein
VAAVSFEPEPAAAGSGEALGADEPTGVFVPTWDDDGPDLDPPSAPASPAWVPIRRDAVADREGGDAPVSRPRLFDDETAVTNPAALAPDVDPTAVADDDWHGDDGVRSASEANDDPDHDSGAGIAAADDRYDGAEDLDVDDDRTWAAADERDLDAGDAESGWTAADEPDLTDTEPAWAAAHDGFAADDPWLPDEPAAAAATAVVLGADATDPGTLRPVAPGSETVLDRPIGGRPPTVHRLPSRGQRAVQGVRAFAGLALLILIAGVGLAAAIGLTVGGLAFVLRQTLAG